MGEPQLRTTTEASVMHGLGVSAFQRGNIETALKFMALACVHPEAPPIWHRNHAEMLDRSGNSELAEAAIRLALERDPEYAEAWETLGTILAQRNEHEESCACYQRATEIEPKFVQALNNLAVILNFLGRKREALARYSEVSRLAPENQDIQMNYANLLVELGRHQEGLEVALKILDRYPNSKRAHSVAKELRLKLKRRAKSEKKKDTSAAYAFAIAP